MQDDGVIDLDFSIDDDVGVDLDGAEIGMFSGRASIDKDGFVVGLTLDTLVYDTARQFGPLRQATREIKVPTQRNQLTSLPDLIARALADTIEKRFKSTISDKLNDWCVSLAEQEWEYQEAAE